ncbi:MAG: CRTAC1 family protein [Verrucomicrobia bacterium]|nr:MAG: CRTAC1 family protein [Verrucomicrobiota bacterium]
MRANRIYEVDEAGAEVKADIEHRTSNNQQPTTNNQQPVFEDVSHLIQHTHHEEEYDDFARQPLLPKKLSQLGPGVAWFDVDGDGWDDLIVGSGRGGRLAVYLNDGKGGFNWWSGAPFDKVAGRDQTGVLGTDFGLLVGSANYEDGQTNGGCVRIYDVKRRVSGESVLGQEFSAGPLALADVDGDGDLDLFVGGRVLSGRYPAPADSLLLNNEGGRLMVGQRFEKLGLVSGAVFSDLDGDGKPELILACEWGPLRIFRNDRGHLVAWDAPVADNQQPATHNQQKVTLNQLNGWWNGVTTGDLDGDGRLDIIVSNWGLNSRYRTSREHPRKLYFGQLGGKGVDLVEGYYDELLKGEVPERDLRVVGRAMPFVREKFGSFEAYGKATLAQIYGPSLKEARSVEVSTLESMVFLNRGDHFEGRPLPPEAQLAPAFALCVADFDGDGKEDLFVSQNFFAVAPDSSRCDAGRGLWLRGDGQGGLSAVSGQESGILVYGEQRGAALCDYDQDGRVDLVVTQNGAETKLYHNVGGQAGLRVRLRGPAANPRAVGAQMRLSFGTRQGPMREIHAGSGYWSQDSAVQVLGRPEPPTQIQVRWPGGRVTTSALPEKAREISIDSTGKLEVLRMSER